MTTIALSKKGVRTKKAIDLLASRVLYPRERIFQEKCLRAILDLTKSESYSEKPLSDIDETQLKEYYEQARVTKALIGAFKRSLKRT